jgi:hypothetical protein
MSEARTELLFIMPVLATLLIATPYLLLLLVAGVAGIWWPQWADHWRHGCKWQSESGYGFMHGKFGGYTYEQCSYCGDVRRVRTDQERTRV